MTFDASHGFAFAVLGATMLCAGTAHAHFVLHTPAANLEQGPLGDPQKEFPCGGAGMETGMITAYQAGDTVTITVDETVMHPGHFRVALALNDMSELPPEPEVTPGDTPCGTVDIMDPPVFPVLADGELLHTEQLPDGSTFDVTLPDDVECEACTLQVLMFMQDHGAPCFYHHCATISIAPGAAEGTTSVSGGDSESSGAGDDSSDGGSSNATTVTTAEGSASAGESESGDTASDTSATTATTAGVTDSASSGDDGGDDSGCGCNTEAPTPLAGMLALFGLVALRRRR